MANELKVLKTQEPPVTCCERENVCGMVDAMERVYCVDCGAETELECICDDLNYADGEIICINGERYARVAE